MNPAISNVVQLLRYQASLAPDRTALICHDDRGRTSSCRFGSLWTEVEHFASGLEHAGLGEGDRVMLLAPPTPEFYALLLALLARGATAVLVDESVRDRAGLRAAIKTARPKALVTVDALARRRALWPALWGIRIFSVDRPRRGVAPLASLRADTARPCIPITRAPDDEAFVTFTSGSTGRPKAVNRTHGVALGQHQALTQCTQQGPGDVHLTTLPVLALHNLGCGATTILAPVDPAEPDARGLEQTSRLLRERAVTHLTGAPRFVVGLCAHLTLRQQVAPTVGYVATGAAPVTRRMCSQVMAALPRARHEVLYGSTEAEPISRVSMSEVLTASGDGHLVGLPVAGTQVAVVALPDNVPSLDFQGLSPYVVRQGEQGEVVVSGTQVVKSYLAAPEADRRHKLRDALGRVWHRTGDVGRWDGQGRLWLTGRVVDLVPRSGDLLAPLGLEAELSEIEGVDGAALIAHRRAPRGELVLQSSSPEASVRVRGFLDGRGLHDVPLVRLAELPVDPRNGSKLDRPRLRAMREAT